jgi:glycosyltransferase involved in cell wall biosynthesis
MTVVFDARWITPEMSGIGRYSAGLLGGLADLADPDVPIVALGGDESTVAGLMDGAASMRFEPFAMPPHAPASQVRLPRALARLGARVFHSPYVFAPPFGARRARLVTTVHDLIPQRYPQGLARSRKVRLAWLWRAWCARQYARSSAIVTVSDFSRREIIKHARIAPDRVTRIHNGVSRSPLDVDGSLFRRRFNVHSRILSTVGRHDPYKNVEGLIRAFDLVAREVSDATLVIAGRLDPRYPEPRELARSLPCAERIVFTDFIDEPTRVSLLRASSVFAFPSRYEGFGLPPLEAMAEGVPVVSSDAASLPEALGDAASLVNPDDTPCFARAIIDLLADASLRAERAAAGRRRAATFTWRRCAEEHLALYRRLLA